MKKIFVLFFLVSSISAYSQTWREASSFGGRFIEFTVISSDEWNRLLVQYQEDRFYCEIIYKDSFEIKTVIDVISGIRPDFNGYYFLYGKWYSNLGIYPVLAYGNSSTGRMELNFGSGPSFGVEIGSDEYINLFNRFVFRISGGANER